MSIIKISNISNRSGDSGPTISGVSTFSSENSSIKLPSGTEAQRVGVESGSLRYNSDYGILEFYNGSGWVSIASTSLDVFTVRGVFGGGSAPSPGTPTTRLEYITISNTSNSILFGSLTPSFNSREIAACSSSTRGVFGGGVSNGNTMEYITIATTGNATDFGDLTVGRNYLAACSSSTRGIFGGGNISAPLTPALSNVLDYITIATTGNATDFGDLTVARRALAACSSSTRGVFGGGQIPSVNTIDYITIATTGNATDFGDLTVVRDYLAACSSSTRGIFGGGSPGGNVIDYITISTTGNATDFGDLTVDRYSLAACSSTTRGVFGGGYAPGRNVIDYITIASTGDASDFGDLTQAKSDLAACSNAHGGL